MARPVTSDNSFGPSVFIVGSSLSNGVSYTSIQSAIDDAALVAPATVIVRPGTYTENLTFKDQVSVIGADASGRLTGGVSIVGTATMAGNMNVLLQNMNFTSTGATLTLSSGSAQDSVGIFTGCSFNSSGSNAIVMSPGSGGATDFEADNCHFQSSTGTLINVTTANQATAVITNSTFVASSAIALSTSTGSIFSFYGCNISSSGSTAFSMSGGTIQAYYSYILASGTSLNFATGGTAIFDGCTHESSDASTNYITGTGTYRYGGDILFGTAQNIAGTVTIQPRSTRPYASTSVKGTASFNSSSFTVTDGAVSLAGPFGGVNWTVVSGTSQALAVQNGYTANNAGLVTFTLPATANPGDLIIVTGLGSGGWAIAQNASQLIHFGSSTTTTGAGGSIASTNANDSITLRCVVANTTFTTTSSIGNLTIV